MINIDDVKFLLSIYKSARLEELEQYLPIINNAVECASKQISDTEHSSGRAVAYAAARANYDISLINNADNVTSFKAGDVSISQNVSNIIESAKALLQSATNNVADIISDNSFAFLGV